MEDTLLLQRLNKAFINGEIKILFAKTARDPFFLWLHWETQRSRVYMIYWLATSDWLWVPLLIFLAVRGGWQFLGLAAVPFLVTRLLMPVGRKLLICNSLNDVKLLDDLWFRGLIVLANSTSKIFAAQRIGEK